MNAQYTKGVLALLVLGWVFATMGVFARYLDVSFALFEQVYLRIALAFVLSILFFIPKITFRKLWTIGWKDFAVFVFRAFFLYAGVVLSTEAILHAKLSVVALLVIVPVMPLLGYILLKEKVRLSALIWIFVGFLGAMLILLNSITTFVFGYGELMAVLSAFAFNLSYIGRKWQSEHLNNYESAVVIFFIGAVLLFVSSLLAGEGLPQVSDFSWWIIWILLLAGLFNTLNLVLTNYGFEHVKVAHAANILTLEIIFALLYGVLLYQEIPTARELIGGCVILVSVYFVNKIEGQDSS